MKTVLVLFMLLFTQFAFGEDYVAEFTSEKIEIDGHLDEKVWEKAKPLEYFIPPNAKKVTSKTIGKVLWDENYLYVGIKAFDKDLFGKLTKRDSLTFQEDVLEIFIMPRPNKEPYYNFEVNILGTFLDGMNYRKTKPHKPKFSPNSWNWPDVKVKTFLKGTANQDEDVDEYWQMEIAIPHKGLGQFGEKPPKDGDIWLFHLARYDYSKYLPDSPELSSTAPLSKVNFHLYADFQKLVFLK